ncbi:uncharacterized protein N7484_009365 [Penicillium longicatenatum]|uniref:uncharacterized protein n=1 Tax=Penicillium longicatenatum TaxID=1561947 RepID=UPI002547D3DA|nr:uncharacterized protein N7484_009365 [Penicillium longicatenatum]KAJ5636052.1 hypothetical protein N7484_009365 [Penicillium longicatenatum]
MTSNIPEILLLCMDTAYIAAFNTALGDLWPNHTNSEMKITTINERLNSIPDSTTFDLIVSPANSYGRLDGAFDHAISMTFSPRHDYHALTRAAQLAIYDKYRGFAPPGSCTLVEFPKDLKENPRGCSWVAICPTMREPDNVNWDREVVYKCTWSLLCEVEGYNRHASAKESATGANSGSIKTLLLTPLAVGVGRVSKERWAAQTVMAFKHFVEAVQKPEVWSRLEWNTIEKMGKEIQETWKDT